MKKFLLILLVFVLVACVKKRTIHISAINAVTKKPYPGLKYELVKEGNTGGFETNYKTVASGTLNENGEVYLTKHLSKGATYTIRVEEPPNCCYNKNISLHFGGESNFEAPFEFAECATLQRVVKNVNCIDTNDIIEIYLNNSVHSLNPNPWILKGCANKTTVPTQFPIGLYTVNWSVTKNNITTPYSDSFYLSEFESKIYEINY